MASKKSSVISVLITGDSKGLSGAVDEANGRLAKLGSAVGLAAKAVAAGAAAIGAVAVREFAKFDAAMQQSVSIMGDVSDALRDDMAKAAREVAKTTTFSAEQAAESFYFLASAGLDAATSIEALPKVAAFAQAGMFDMARATDILTDAQSALGLTSDDAAENILQMSRVSDVLVRAATLANTSVEQLGEALTEKAGAAIKAAGMEFEAGAAALAVFADSGVKGSAAGTKLTAVIASLSTNSRNNADQFRRLGISVFDANGNMRSMEGIVGDMERAFDGMTIEARNAELASLGLNRQALDGINLLLGQSEAMGEYTAAMLEAGGVTDDVANKQMQTFNAQMSLLKSQLVDAAIEIGGALVPALGRLVGWLQSKGPQFSAWAETAGVKISEFIDAVGVKAAEFKTFFDERLKQPLNDVREAITTFVDRAKGKLSEFTAAVPGAVKGFTDFLSEVRELADDPAALGARLGDALGTALLKAFEKIKELSAELNTAIRDLLGRVDWFSLGRSAVTALIQFGLGFAAAFLTFEWLGPVLSAIRNNLGVVLFAAFSFALAPAAVTARVAQILARIPLAGRLLAWIVTALSRFGAAMRDRFALVFRAGADAFTAAIGRLGPGMISRFVTFLRGIPQALTRMFDDLALNVGVGFQTFAGAVGRAVVNLVTRFRELMSFLLTPFRAFGKNIVDDLFMIGRNAIDALMRGLRSMGTRLYDTVSSIGRSVWDTLSKLWKISSPSKVFMGIGEDAMEGLALGLAGSERMLRQMTAGIGDSVLPSINVSGAQGSQPPIIINVTGALDPEGVARQIEKILRDSQRRTGGVLV
jgi:TP901 family phage tail tape measure protein